MTRKNCNTCTKLYEKYEGVISILEQAGLRATSTRVILMCLLFCKSDDHHTTAEKLYEESKITGSETSLATIKKTLALFTSVGILRKNNTGSKQVYYDTDTSEH